MGKLVLKGRHRLLCGDSTSGDDVLRLANGCHADLCFTSPPYAQQRQYTGAGEQDWDALMRGVFSNLPMKQTGQVLVNLGLIHEDGEYVPYWDAWLRSMAKEWRLFGWYVWDKITATFKGNDGRLWVSHEWVFHFNKRAVKCKEWVPCKHAGDDRGPNGQRRPDGEVAGLGTPGKIKTHRPPDSVIRIQRECNNADESVRKHPARFPVALPAFIMQTWPGLVYEPFSGSGTTLVAAESHGMECMAMEIAPQYVDIACRRFEALFKQPPVHETTGKTWTETAKERGVRFG